MTLLVHVLEAVAAVLALGVLIPLAVRPFVKNDPESTPAPAPDADDEWWVGYLEHFPAGAFA
jgi:hypothetical protein